MRRGQEFCFGVRELYPTKRKQAAKAREGLSPTPWARLVPGDAILQEGFPPGWLLSVLGRKGRMISWRGGVPIGW